jgi:hypothetical protein
VTSRCLVSTDAGPAGSPRADGMREIRRAADGELLGLVGVDGDGWVALTVFHGLLARCDTADEAGGVVRERGLASLSERWLWYSRRSGEWRVVLPQEASPGRVRVAVGWYSLPGVETATITADDLASGDRLVLRPPDDVTSGV